MANFIRVSVRNWKEARDIAEHLQGYVFRGQASATWNLSTSIERAAGRVYVPPELMAKQENFMLQGFMRRAHLHVNDLPSRACLFEWLALLQHHGGRTRLLDFTRSYHVASFFAMEDAADNCAVWCVSGDALDERFDAVNVSPSGRSYAGHERSAAITKYVDIELKRQGRPDADVHSQPSPVSIVRAAPFRHCGRLAAQQGTFLVQTDLRHTFTRALRSTLGLGDDEDFHDMPICKNAVSDYNKFLVIKLEIPQAQCAEGIRLLEETNVTTATLFPGLDGFARSLKLFEVNRDLWESMQGTQPTAAKRKQLAKTQAQFKKLESRLAVLDKEYAAVRTATGQLVAGLLKGSAEKAVAPTHKSTRTPKSRVGEKAADATANPGRKPGVRVGKNVTADKAMPGRKLKVRVAAKRVRPAAPKTSR